MSQQDRQKWNAKYARGDHGSTKPSALITALDELLPKSGRALDVAGGAGRHSLWLAQRGMTVTLADISTVGLELAQQRAEAARLAIHTVEIDLEEQPFPSGPWELILSTHFLHRPLFAEFASHLRPQGLLVVVQPTRTNLQRHEKPPAAFLLEDQELPSLIEDLQIIHYEEGWLAEGRHDAVIVARRGA